MIQKHNEKLQFIFAWRLTHEKWADLLVSLVTHIQQRWVSSQCHVHIYGEWPYRKELEAYACVSCYWFQPQEVVFEKRSEVQYSLMPSRFLETFWLSALESLRFGVPVIGEKKWGLAQFDEWVIDQNSAWSFEQTVTDVILNHDQTEYDRLSKTCLQIADRFSRDIWLERVEWLYSSMDTSVDHESKLSHIWWSLSDKHVLLPSDYIWQIWGIETYITSVSKNCKNELWCATVTVFGWDVSMGGWMRYLSLPMSACNVYAFVSLQHLWRTMSYDLVRWHSVQRWLGPLPFFAVSSATPQWMMYHDFGLFHPFPSQVTSEDQLVESASFLWYMRQWYIWKTVLQKLLRTLPLCVKHLSTKIILAVLARRIDIHLVPSAYMVPHVQRLYTQSVRVEVLTHSL